MDPSFVESGRSRKYCSVMGCGVRYGKMFSFPKDCIYRGKWVLACKIMRKVSESMVVCKRHFRPSDLLITLNGKLRMKKGSIPSLHLPKVLIKKTHRDCSVHGCMFRQVDDVSLHYFPKSDMLRKLWQAVCKMKKTPTRNMVICGKHFHDDDFIKMDDGSKVLRSGVVPSRRLPSSSRKCSVAPSKQWKIKCSCNMVNAECPI